MALRLVLGLIKGIAIGGLLATLLVYGLGMPVMAAWVAYPAALAAGALTGLVAGKPIWAKGARIEAGLKALAGSVVAAGAMFAIRRWLSVSLDLGALGKGLIGELPIASLPMIATALALFFEIDNTGDGAEPGKKKEAMGGKQRIEALTQGEGEEISEQEPAASRKAQKS